MEVTVLMGSLTMLMLPTVDVMVLRASVIVRGSLAVKVMVEAALVIVLVTPWRKSVIVLAGTRTVDTKLTVETIVLAA